jgi:hypothetical protein
VRFLPNQSLEHRVATLERQVAELKAQAVNGRDQKPWLRVQGIFAGNEGMKEVFDEALRLRELDRRRARRTRKKAPTRRVKK